MIPLPAPALPPLPDLWRWALMRHSAGGLRAEKLHSGGQPGGESELPFRNHLIAHRGSVRKTTARTEQAPQAGREVRRTEASGDANTDTYSIRLAGVRARPTKDGDCPPSVGSFPSEIPNLGVFNCKKLKREGWHFFSCKRADVRHALNLMKSDFQSEGGVEEKFPWLSQGFLVLGLSPRVAVAVADAGSRARNISIFPPKVALGGRGQADKGRPWRS